MLVKLLRTLIPVIVLLGFSACSSNKLPITNDSVRGYPIHYIHAEKPSLKSQFVQLAAGLSGAKKIIEKQIKRRKFSQETAPVPDSLRKVSQISQNLVLGRVVYTITPISDQSNKMIFYVHGGAHIGPITKYTWALVEEVMQRTGATFVVPDYPLVPDASHRVMQRYLLTSYRQLIKKHDTDVVLMGDSSGGGMALSLAMTLRDKQLPQPEQIILLAPWLDMTLSNPDIAFVNKKDTILGVKGLQMAGRLYASDTDLKDYRVSPLYGDLSDLPKMSIFVGTSDILLPDVRRLLAQASKLDSHVNYFEYPRMFHIWIFMRSLREAQHSIDQIASLILDK